MTASEFVTKAIENNVLIIPGNVFSERDTHFRISYATTDEKLARDARFFASSTNRAAAALKVRLPKSPRNHSNILKNIRMIFDVTIHLTCNFLFGHSVVIRNRINNPELES